jgi:hypothetical protein
MKKIILIVSILGTITSCNLKRLTTIYHVDSCPDWTNCIINPANKEYVEEVAFNLNIRPEQVTQEQFNSRYLN